MCGIMGYIGDRETTKVILEGLAKHEYRGYDSAGIAVIKDGKISELRTTGRVFQLAEKVAAEHFTGDFGIGHTRWATHGGVTENNAHPHMSSDNKVVLVHNGIIENAREIRAEAARCGVEPLITDDHLAVEDAIACLEWAKSLGAGGLIARSDANAAALNGWVDRTPWASNLAADPATRSNTSVCIRIDGPADLPKAMASLLEKEGVAFDINGYRDAPPSLRIWCGATVDTADIEALIPWLDWAYATAKEA